MRRCAHCHTQCVTEPFSAKKLALRTITRSLSFFSMVSVMNACRTLLIVLYIVILLVKANETEKKHLKSVKQSSKQTVTVGKGTSFLTGDNLKIKKTSTSCKLQGSNGKTKKGKCLKVVSTALPNHDVGPWCSGGKWDKKTVNFPDKKTGSCLCERFHCDTTCSDLCMECTPTAKSLIYLIPLTPILRDDDDTAVAADGTTNHSADSLIPVYSSLTLFEYTYHCPIHLYHTLSSLLTLSKHTHPCLSSYFDNLFYHLRCRFR